jgi:hypothetical protein
MICGQHRNLVIQLQVLLELFGNCKSQKQKKALRGEARKAIRQAERLIRRVQNKVDEVRLKMDSFSPDVEANNQ